MENSSPQAKTSKDHQKMIGLAFIVLPILIVGVASQHPFIESHGLLNEAKEYQQKLVSFMAIHGALITMCILLSGFIVAFFGRNKNDLTVLIGITFWCSGSVFMAIAGMIDGFIVPIVMIDYSQWVAADTVNPGTPAILEFAIYLGHVTVRNVFLWGVGFWLTATILFCLSFILTKTARTSAKVMGWIGILMSVCCILGLSIGLLKIDIIGLGIILTLTLGWQPLLGVVSLLPRHTNQ